MEAKKVTIGTMSSVKINLEPMFKNLHLENKAGISLYCGKNGTGKTLILIFQWIFACLANIYLSTAKSQEEYNKLAKFFVDRSFDNNNFTGEVAIGFDNMDMSFKLDNGVVSDFEAKVKDPNVVVEPSGMPVYMSKSTRLFTEIVQYLKTKKLLGIGEITLSNENDMEKLTELYKLYDILFIERMVMRLKNPNFKIRDEAKKSFVENMEKEIFNVTYDETKCVFTVHEMKDGKEITYPATIMSSGEQAWLNMFIQM